MDAASLLMGLVGWLQSLDAAWAGWVVFGLMALATLVSFATVIVKLTPVKTDDEWLARLQKDAGWFFKIVDSLSLISPKKKD